MSLKINRPGALHRVRRPFWWTPVHDGVPGRVHRPGPGISRNRSATARQAGAVARSVRL